MTDKSKVIDTTAGGSELNPGACSEWVTRWRVRRMPEETHQLIASGGNLICPAVLGACGPAANPDHDGEFWWSRDGQRGYVATLDEAKTRVEAPNVEVMREDNNE